MPRRRLSRIALLLAALSLLCYLPAINWGVINANAPGRKLGWAVDDETPIGSIIQVREIVKGPTPNRNLGYPLGHPLVVVAAYVPYLVYLKATGALRDPSGDFPFGLRDPVGSMATLAVIAHVISAVFAVLAVLSAWSAARDLWRPSAGFAAGLFAMTTFPMWYYARTGNIDMAQIGWMALAMAAAARMSASGVSTRRAVVLGLAAGAAVGTKEPVAAALLIVPVMVASLQWFDHRSGRVRLAAWWLPALVAGVVFALAFGLFSGLLLNSERYRAHLAFNQERIGDAASGAVAFASQYPWTAAGNLSLARKLVSLLADSLTAPGLVLAAAGIWIAARRRPRTIWLAISAAIYLTVLFVGAHIAMLRYVMPAAWVLALYAGNAAAAGWESTRAPLKWLTAAVAALALLLNLGRGADLTFAMLNDSRYAAADWFKTQAAPGTKVVYFGSGQKLPTISKDVQTRRSGESYGAINAVPADEGAADRIVEQWKASPPDFILLMPDHSSQPGVWYPASCPPSLVEALENGRLGYRLAAAFETPRLMPWIRRPLLDYPTVNPPIRIYRRVTG